MNRPFLLSAPYWRLTTSPDTAQSVMEQPYRLVIQKEKISSRIPYLDFLKFFAIACVFVGHSVEQTTDNDFWDNPIWSFIYTFHMPLFFFLSGTLFSFEKHPTFKEFALKRFKRIIVPYLWINLITYIFWLFVGRNFGMDSSHETVWYDSLLSTLLGIGKIEHNPPMWFFLCLYTLEIIYYIIFKPLKNNARKTIIVLFVIACLGYINYRFNPFPLPFYLGPALVGMVFYGIGNVAAHHIKEFYTIKPVHIVILLFSFLILLFVSQKNGYVIMSDNNYQNYLLFFVSSLAGIGTFVIIGNWLSIKPFSKKFITYVSQNTLLINSFHLLVFSILKGIMVFVLHIPLESLYGHNATAILFAAVSLVLCLPVAYIINRYFPFIVGKKKSPLRG